MGGRPLCPCERDPVPIVQLGVWAPEDSGRGQKSHPLHRNSIPEVASSQQVAILTLPSLPTICLLQKILKGKCTEYDMIYDIFVSCSLTPGGSSTVHIYTQRIHRTIKLTTWTTQLTTRSISELSIGTILN